MGGEKYPNPNKGAIEFYSHAVVFDNTVTIQGQSSEDVFVYHPYAPGEKGFIPFAARIDIGDKEKIVINIKTVGADEDGASIGLNMFNITTTPVRANAISIYGISIT